MAAPIDKSGSQMMITEFVTSILDNKVTISHSARLNPSKLHKYTLDLSLNNRDVPHELDSKKRQARIKSATLQRPARASHHRRVQSAKERKTSSVIAAQQQSQLNLVPYKVKDKCVVPERPSKLSAGFSKDHSVINELSGNMGGSDHYLSTCSDNATKSYCIPEALQSLSPYISQQLADCVSHPALRDTISLLPGLGETYGKDIPVIPPVHSANDDYPFTHDVPATHLHKPKKYSHPYYERLKKIKGWTCNHNGREVRIGSVTGETIHRFVINVNRNTSSVRGEIVELERLIKGLSTEWTTSTVALYQNEINDLQRMVKHTLSMTTPLDSPPATPDPTGMRGFCKEYDTALQALVVRHQQCMEELKEIEEIDKLYDRAKRLEDIN